VINLKKFKGPLSHFLVYTAFWISQSWISQVLLYLFTFQRFIHVFYYCDESVEIFLFFIYFNLFPYIPFRYIPWKWKKSRTLLKTRPTYAAPKEVHSVKGPCFIIRFASVTPFPDGLVFFLHYRSSIINHYAKCVLYKQQ